MLKLTVRYNSPVVLTYALLCVAALFVNFLTRGASNAALFMVYRCSLTNPLAWFRFFGHIIGHADLAHLVSNMMYLLLIGPALEEKYGGKRLLLCILTTALVTGLVQFFLFNSALLGASGVVFMMIVLMSFSGGDRQGIPLTLILVLVMYVGSELYTGLVVNDNVSQLCHILGGAVGLGYGFLFRKQG